MDTVIHCLYVASHDGEDYQWYGFNVNTETQSMEEFWSSVYADDLVEIANDDGIVIYER